MLVEVHDEEELETRARVVDADVIGINNRDLADFSVDIERTYELLADVPAGKTVVSESGFSTREQLDELERVGVDAVLVGETLMRARRPRGRLPRARGRAVGRIVGPFSAASAPRPTLGLPMRGPFWRPLLAAAVGGGVAAAGAARLGAGERRPRRSPWSQRSGAARASPPPPAASAARPPPTIYARDAPGVVFIRAATARRARPPFDVARHEQRDRGDRLRLRRSTTTGTILTNAHVVDEATELQVTSRQDNTVAEAESSARTLDTTSRC